MTPEAAGLLGVGIGGVLTFAGGAVRDQMTRGERKREVLRSRVEEIYELACELDRWWFDYFIHSIGEVSQGFNILKEAPSRDKEWDANERMEALIVIYQPTLAGSWGKVRVAEETLSDSISKYNKVKGDFIETSQQLADDVARLEKHVILIGESHKALSRACQKLKAEACEAGQRYV